MQHTEEIAEQYVRLPGDTIFVFIINEVDCIADRICREAVSLEVDLFDIDNVCALLVDYSCADHVRADFIERILRGIRRSSDLFRYRKVNDCDSIRFLYAEIAGELIVVELKLDRNSIAVRLDLDKFIFNNISLFVRLRLKERNIVENRVAFIVVCSGLFSALRRNLFSLVIQGLEVCVVSCLVLCARDFLNRENGVVRDRRRIHHFSCDLEAGVRIFIDVSRLLILHRIVQQNLRILLHVLKAKFSHLFSANNCIIIFVCFKVIPSVCALDEDGSRDISLERGDGEVQRLVKLRRRKVRIRFTDGGVVFAGYGGHCNHIVLKRRFFRRLGGFSFGGKFLRGVGFCIDLLGNGRRCFFLAFLALLGYRGRGFLFFLFFCLFDLLIDGDAFGCIAGRGFYRLCRLACIR